MSVVAASPWESGTWLPVRGRPPICRESGCGEPATDDLQQVCVGHGWWQPKSAPGARGPKSRPRRVDDLAALTGPELSTSWADKAACKDVGIDFFPDQEAGPEAERAKAVCAGCPVLVRQGCLEFGLHERFGIWGGLTTEERTALRKIKRPSAA